MLDIYLDQSATLLIPGGYDAYNRRKAESETQINCLFEWKTRIINNAEGEEIVSSGKVTMKNRTLTTDYRIKKDSTIYTILKIIDIKSFGYSYKEAYLQ